jgi:hypothetical protein
MKLRALTFSAALASILAADACAQSSIQAAARNKILDSTSSRHRSADAMAGHGNRALYFKSITFVDPLRTTEMDWGAGLGVNSVGTFSEICKVQVPSPPRDPGSGVPYWHCKYFESEDPKWSFGLGPSASGSAGRLRAESGKTLRVPYNPREIRLRAIDTAESGVQISGALASTRLHQGRTSGDAWLVFNPPWPPGPGRPVCTGDLVLDIRYGIDGVHEPDPQHAVVAERWLDLDLRYAPNGNLLPGPRGQVTIRAEGQAKAAPRGAGWPGLPEQPGIPNSTIFVDTSMGSRAPLTFSWNNGMVAGPRVPWTQVFDTWQHQTVRIPMNLSVPMRVDLALLTEQRQMLGRGNVGRSAVPDGFNRAGTGHGLDVRVYLDNLQPAQCRPDYVPPRMPTIRP